MTDSSNTYSDVKRWFYEVIIINKRSAYKNESWFFETIENMCQESALQHASNAVIFLLIWKPYKTQNFIHRTWLNTYIYLASIHI